jgi:flagellar protein FliO/FliZ
LADLAAPLSAAPPTSDLGLTGVALQMAGALLLILAVIFLAFWILRRFGPKFGLGPGGRGGMLRLVSQLALGPRKSVMVVRFLNRDLVLGVTDQTITLLTEVPTDHESNDNFAQTLDRAGRAPGEDPQSP